MKGVITWFVDNVVAANLLMFILLAGGIMSLFTTHQEEFPNVDPDVVSVTVPYLGASPEEVERGVLHPHRRSHRVDPGHRQGEYGQRRGVLRRR